MDKKIIHITLGKANPNRLNGVNKVVNSLIDAQVKLGYDSELWGITHNCVHNYPERNYQTRIFKDTRSKFKLSSDLKRAINELSSKEVIVHLHGAFLPQLYSVSRLLRKNNIPYIHTPHGGYNLKALEVSKLQKRIYMRFFEKKLVNNAACVQLLGESELKGLNLNFLAKSFAIIPNGQDVLDTEDLDPRNKSDINLVFLGRIDIKTKGLDLLTDAVKQIKQELKVHLTIIGDGGDIEQLKSRISESELDDQISFAGALFGKEKFQELIKADALCLVSRNEGMPGVVLEAGAVGIPVLISEQTNMVPYIWQYDAGWWMKDYSVESLCESLFQMYKDKKNSIMKQKGHNARKMISEKFAWDKIAASLITEYAKA
ncbi:MAG: glycosyltransferase [Flavobacteriales bacterium]|nr:glycosyltransferase [Flavobacteriales bacterium]